MCKECQKYYILAIKNINVDKCDLEKMLDFATSTFSVWKADYQAVPLSKPWGNDRVLWKKKGTSFSL